MKKNSSYIVVLLFFIVFTKNVQAITSNATWEMQVLSQQTLVLNALRNQVDPGLAAKTDTVFVSGATNIQAQSNGNNGYYVTVQPTTGAGATGTPFEFAETGGSDKVPFTIAKGVALANQGWQATGPATTFGQNDKVIDFTTQTVATQLVEVSFVVSKADVLSVSTGTFTLPLTATLTDYP